MNRCSVSRPSAPERGNTTVTLHFSSDDDETLVEDWTCIASVAKTAFYVDAPTWKHGRQTSHFKRVAFSTFKKYIKVGDEAELTPRSKFHWIWSSDKHGHSYRYIESISISKYVG